MLELVFDARLRTLPHNSISAPTFLHLPTVRAPARAPL